MTSPEREQERATSEEQRLVPGLDPAPDEDLETWGSEAVLGFVLAILVALGIVAFATL